MASFGNAFLEGQVAIVTGAAQGNGYAIAERLAAHGVPEDELFFKQISRDLVKLDKAGAPVVLGAHGNRQGIGVHWELWGKVEGGATPWTALRDATIDATRAYVDEVRSGTWPDDEHSFH